MVLVLTACAPASPRAQSSLPPTAIPTATSSPSPTSSPAPAPTRVPGSPLSWTAPVVIDHQPPYDGNGMNSISCPTINLCVAVEYSNVITSSNPTGGAAAWTVTNVDGFTGGDTPFMSVVTCTGEVLCVAIDGNSDSLVTSTKPTGGAAAWKVTKLPAATNLRDLSCPSPSMCVGVGGDATVLTSRNPTGGATAWTAVRVAGLPVCGPRGEGSTPCGLTGVSCPTETFCAAVDTVGNLITSRNPFDGAASWKVSRLGKLLSGVEGVTCGAPELCVLLGYNDIATSSTPTAGVTGWKKPRVPSRRHRIHGQSSSWIPFQSSELRSAQVHSGALGIVK